MDVSLVYRALLAGVQQREASDGEPGASEAGDLLPVHLIHAGGHAAGGYAGGRGFHSSTSQLNLSRFCLRNHPAHPTKSINYKVDERKPLAGGAGEGAGGACTDAPGTAEPLT